MNAIQTKRLLKLANFLDTLPRAKFNFAVIAEVGEKPMLEALKAGKHRCGTVACAAGWMPAVFPRTFRWDGYETEGNTLNIATRNGETVGIEAAENFFGIDYYESHELFVPSWAASSPSANATPKQVAAHIRRFVKRKQAKAAK